MSSIPTDLSDILSEIGLPVVAGTLAYGLIKGATLLEESAREERLLSISKLLKEGPLTALGPLGGVVVPLIFEKMFGEKPFSKRFILSSVTASVMFWLIRCAAKHFNVYLPIDLPGDDVSGVPYWNHTTYLCFATTVGSILLLDWISLAKARYIISKMSFFRYKSMWTIYFVLTDLLITYLIANIALVVINWSDWVAANPNAPVYNETFSDIFPPDQGWLWLKILIYFETGNIGISTNEVMIVSTLFTSVWVILLLLSGLIVGLLVPVEYIRRFTLWWFKDVDTHPLTTIAKVAATLVIFGAFLLKVVRWTL